MFRFLRNKLQLNNKTIFGQFFINVTLIIVLALLILATIYYQYTRKILVNSFEEKNSIIYGKIKDILAMQDASLEVLENSVDKRAKQLSRILWITLQNEDSLENLNLERLRREIGMDAETEDIYLINRQGIVVNTTFKNDLYLNFYNFGEEHKKYLINVFNNRKFVSERFAIEASTRRMKKYTYQPIQNGKYILELGFYSEKADEIANFVKNMLNKLSDENPNIISVDLFIGKDAPFSLNKPNIPLNETNLIYIKEVFDKGNNIEHQKYFDGKKVHVQYIYMSRKNTDLYKSSVIRIITDRSDERNALANITFYSLLIFGVALIVIIFFIYRKAKNITRPIENLVANVKRIASGNFRERAKVEGDNEIAVFSRHFNHMLNEIERYYDELEEAKAKAEESDRLKSAFLANMSHEIRTPMNSVIGFTEILDKEITDPVHKNYLESIIYSGRNLLALINDILDLSKIEAGKLELTYNYFNLEPVITEIKQMFAAQLHEKGLQAQIEIPKTLPDIKLDEVRVRQILINLVGNAVKFTEKGSVSIGATYHCEDHEPDCCNINMWVKDTGIGMDEKTIQMVFDPFKQKEHQDNRKYGGTGLGLSITQRLTEMMHGKIDVESKLGEFTKFMLSFSNVRMKKPEHPKNAISDYDFKKLDFKYAKVLIADDVPMNRKLLAEFLRKSNIIILEAEDGKQAVDTAIKETPALILMDIRMPVMSGKQAFKVLRENDLTKHIPVIAITASVMKEEKESLMNQGFNSFLQKPIKSSNLFRELTKYLNFIEKAETKEKPKEEVIDKEIINNQENDHQKIELTTHQKDVLKKDIFELWNKAQNTHMIPDITLFAQVVIKFGKENKIENFMVFGEKLLSFANNFDIDNISSLLEYFPEAIKNMGIKL